MRILITGTSGFVGSNLLKHLTRPELEIVPLRGRGHINLLDQKLVIDFLRGEKPDCVVHIAGNIGGIIANQKFPGDFIYQNLIMGLNLIEGSRIAGVRKFVNVGTICSYPAHPQTIPFIESELWNGYPEIITAPYGIAKKTLHEVLKAYRSQYSFNGITCLPTNIYGENDHFEGENVHVVPALISRAAKLKKNEPLELLGDGTATRELIYIGDFVRAIETCIFYYNEEEPINIGTGVETTIEKLAANILVLMGKDSNPIAFKGDGQLNGQQRRCLNIDKLKALGFSPTVSLEDGLRRTIEFYQQNYV